MSVVYVTVQSQSIPCFVSNPLRCNGFYALEGIEGHEFVTRVDSPATRAEESPEIVISERPSNACISVSACIRWVSKIRHGSSEAGEPQTKVDPVAPLPLVDRPVAFCTLAKRLVSTFMHGERHV